MGCFQLRQELDVVARIGFHEGHRLIELDQVQPSQVHLAEDIDHDSVALLRLHQHLAHNLRSLLQTYCGAGQVVVRIMLRCSLLIRLAFVSDLRFQAVLARESLRVLEDEVDEAMPFVLEEFVIMYVDDLFCLQKLYK